MPPSPGGSMWPPPPPPPTGGRKRGWGNWKSYFFPARICPLLINPKGVITAGRIISTILYHNISCTVGSNNDTGGKFCHRYRCCS